MTGELPGREGSWHLLGGAESSGGKQVIINGELVRQLISMGRGSNIITYCQIHLPLR